MRSKLQAIWNWLAARGKLPWWKKLYRRSLLASLAALFLFIILNFLFPLPAEKSFSQVILANDGALLNAYLTPDDKWRMYTSADEVPPELIQAVIAKEDRYFHWHPGVNPIAITRALFSNIFAGKRTSGASTITMQVARMMENRPRTYISKVIEMFRAFQLELAYSKKEILSLYLSYLPYGGNVEGVKAASLIYFDRMPDKLSLAQCALLTVIPNRPNSLRLDRYPELAKQARDKWLNHFLADAVFDASRIKQALDEPVLAERHQIDPKAPHFCLEVRKMSDEAEVKTTLDPEIQEIAERLLRNYVQRVKHKRVSNGAVIVIDNEANQVVAYCGSADFFDNQSQGQVNGIHAVRSPGSTLKPALYAYAFDQGIITPGTRINDIPVNFSGYNPENYDREFHGEVSVRQALMQSLNIPPVRLLHQVGAQKFIDLLARNGFESIRKKREGLGLSVILGGCGATLQELAHFYTAFSHEGRLLPLNFIQKDENEDVETDVEQVFSPGAAWMTADILSGISRPDLPNELISATNKPKIAWKTGTSFGKRDAWCIAFSARYTIGVWMGNFSGEASPDLSGAVMAMPLAFELFNGIEGYSKKSWFPRPAGVGLRTVCSRSGNIPSAPCEHTEEEFFLKKVSASKPCTLNKMIYVDDGETIQYCTGCLPQEGYKRMNMLVLDPELYVWYDEHHIDYPKPPPHNPLCEAKHGGQGPAILSPVADEEFLLEQGKGQEVMLQAASDVQVSMHYWYVNGEFFRSARPGEKIFLKPAAGELKITCMDDHGRAAAVGLVVRYF